MASVKLDRKLEEIKGVTPPKEVWEEEEGGTIVGGVRDSVTEVIQHDGAYGSLEHMKNNAGRKPPELGV